MTHPETRRKRALVASGLMLLIFALATACASSDPGPPVAPTGDVSPPEAAVRGSVPAEPTAAPPTPAPPPTSTPRPRPSSLTGARSAPELADTGRWINSQPFTLFDQSLKGKVVLVDFWTYTCINCIRTMPYLRDWHEKYADKGLVILGVHTPEFEFEKVFENVAEAVEGFGLKYPVVQDNDFGTWKAFENRSWPAKYLTCCVKLNGYRARYVASKVAVTED
jgi:thiol-disulfide isomerase/thioredoxin